MAGHYLRLPSHPPPVSPGPQVRPGVVRHAHGGEFADRLPFSAGGDVRVLSQGGRAPVGVEGHLWRHDSLHDPAMHRLVHCHLVSPDCPVVPELVVRPVGTTMALGFCGRVLRVDLTSRHTWVEEVPEATYERWLGGVGLGSTILYREVGPEIGWDHPDNRVILASGPLAGTRLSGSGELAAVTRGPMTGGACSTQANGFYGAYLKTQGYDAVVIQGQSPEAVYLLVHEGGKAELRSAQHLLGLDTWELGERLKAELNSKTASIFGIGPAGENRVRFAALVGDKGHVAAHNGVGAVLGAKRLKAIVVARGPGRPRGHNEAELDRGG